MITKGSTVVVNCIEGFGGRAFVVDTRESPGSKYKVRMMDGSQPDFWAHDFEVEESAMTDDDVVRSTAEHIRRVGMNMADVIGRLARRAVVHDASKWSEREWPAFKEATPRLASLTYGSEEYKASLRSIKPAIESHNGNNSHHPEHYGEKGIDGMDLLDLIEMMCDWKAATERHADGSISKSLDHNRERFKINPQLEAVLRNTVERMGWMPAPAKENNDVT